LKDDGEGEGRHTVAPQREWFEKDYYKTLGVASTASAKEITSAYRKLAKKNHPDTNPGKEEAFKEISAAYDVLGDADRRKEYDEVRALGPMAGGFPGGFGGGGGTTFRVDVGDLGDLFGGLFGRGRRGGGGGGGGTGPQRGADVEAELRLSFEDAVKGITTSVNVTTDVRCHTCHGSGAAPGTQPMTCPQCGGTGSLQDNQGLFSLSQICPRCGGRGTIIGTPCPTCHGTGNERRNRSVKVRIPPGVEDGQRIRVKGRGAAGRNSGPSGDLYVVVRVAGHSTFGRRGRNLTLTVPVAFAEAALGTTLTVPTLGDPVTLKVPAGTPSGRTFRVKGRGVPGDKKHGSGDLLVTVEVAVPAKLSKEQRAAIERLTEVLEPPARAVSEAGAS
jgi:molecular chaperone DnaJ